MAAQRETEKRAPLRLVYSRATAGESDGGRIRNATFGFPATTADVAAVRRCTEALLGVWGVRSDDRDALVLLVGELAANAAVHGRAKMHLALSLRGSVVEATVVDRGERTSDGTGTLPEDEHGRGLHIVAAIAQTFHLVHTPRGSTARLQYHLAAAT